MRSRTWILIIIAVIILGALAFWLWPHPVLTPGAAHSYQDATYLVEGVPVTLKDGMAVASSTPSSSLMEKTSILADASAAGDLDGDKKADEAFVLSRDGGGSGTFYYLAAALAVPGGYQGTNAVFLGDRIAIQSVEVEDEQASVTYLDHASGSPMASAPTLSVTKRFEISNGMLVEME
ncbi:MAG TPA: hypothetical protein VFL98_02425 [Candidatus Paceibacterota bacterium]|nr:hypothetical protein [Candidatus Paceibacterota bacterium]